MQTFMTPKNVDRPNALLANAKLPKAYFPKYISDIILISKRDFNEFNVYAMLKKIFALIEWSFNKIIRGSFTMWTKDMVLKIIIECLYSLFYVRMV